MAATASVSAPPYLNFGEQAVEMERYAVRRLNVPPPLQEEERQIVHGLLRHARGIKALAEKWRSLND